MATRNLLAEQDAQRRAALQHALGEVLPQVPAVEAAWARVEGDYVKMHALVPELTEPVLDAFWEVEEQLMARFEGALTFEVVPLERSRQGGLAGTPDYVRRS